MNNERINLMQKVLQQTESPALALQAMLHTVVADRYYNYLPRFADWWDVLVELLVGSPSIAPPESTLQTSTYAVDAIYPVRSRGFTVVMGALAPHFVLEAYICIVFGGVIGGAATYGIKDTIATVDQAWQAYAQMAGLLDLVALDRHATTLDTDWEVERKLERHGFAGTGVCLE